MRVDNKIDGSTPSPYTTRHSLISFFSRTPRNSETHYAWCTTSTASLLSRRSTHREREEHRVKTPKSAEVAVNTLCSERINQDKLPTNEMFRNIYKGLCGAFKWSLEDREDFVEFLLGQQLDARLCRTEADIAIAADCLSKDIVLSQDSDFFAYNSVDMIWRPVGKQDEIKVLECNKRTLLARIGLSTTKFTALACVSSNDYKKNIPSLGINTNYKVTKGLTDAGKNKYVLQSLVIVDMARLTINSF